MIQSCKAHTITDHKSNQNKKLHLLLLDDRFLRNDYRELFPREWDDCRRVTLKTVRQELENFWNRL